MNFSKSRDNVRQHVLGSKNILCYFFKLKETVRLFRSRTQYEISIYKTVDFLCLSSHDQKKNHIEENINTHTNAFDMKSLCFISVAIVLVQTLFCEIVRSGQYCEYYYILQIFQYTCVSNQETHVN